VCYGLTIFHKTGHQLRLLHLGRVQQCVYQKPVKDVDELKQRLVEVWSAMMQSTNREDVSGPVFE